ncbi:MAG: T9SS type A sorting domain-containing protein [Bacteroidota bacterium]
MQPNASMRAMVLCALMVCLTYINNFATTYHTVAAGGWSSSSHWTPTLPPNPLPAGDTIVVRHDMIFSNHLVINGHLEVEAGFGNLMTSNLHELEIYGSAEIHGMLQAYRITIGAAATLLVEGSMEAWQGFWNYGTITNNGWVRCDFFRNAGFITGNNGYFRVYSFFNNTATGMVTGVTDVCNVDEITDSRADEGGRYDTTVTFCNFLLPVELVDFQATPRVERVDVSWMTASEKNASYFVVERAVGAEAFLEIGRVNAVGNSAITQRYAFEDLAPAWGRSLYRVTEVDIEGHRTEFPAREVVFDASEKPHLHCFPNPAEQIMNIRFRTGQAGQYHLELYTTGGRKVKAQTLDLGEAFQVEQSLDIEVLPEGIYLLKVHGPAFSQVKKVAKFSR